MKKLPNALKSVGILVCIVLLVTVLFFDIIVLIVPGNFSGWVYVAEVAVWAAIGMLALVTLIKAGCKRHKVKRIENRAEL